MKPKTKNRIHLIISIIILVVSVVFSLCKWILYDIDLLAEFLVFIINIQLWIFTVFFMIFSMVKLRGGKRLTVAFIYFACIILHIIFYSEFFHINFDYIRNREIRQQVVERIAVGDYELDKNNKIILKDDEQRCISKRGFIGLISTNTNEGKGVYFCINPGLVDSSSGYVYFIDNVFDNNKNIVYEDTKLIYELDDDIYWIGTY